MDFFRRFKPPTKFAQEFLFFSDGMGHLKSEDFLVDRIGFNNNLVMFVLSGKLHVEQNGHFVLHQNEGVLLRLMNKHKYYTDPIDICEILWMHFNGRQSEVFMKLIEQKHGLPAIFKEIQVAHQIRDCFEIATENNSETEFMISKNIYTILLLILNKVCHEEILSIPPSEIFISQAEKYIEENIFNKITLTNFAKQFNISLHHFCRVFKKCYHTTPIQYVLQKKIEMSKYLLAYTHDSLSSISECLCFSDQSHFTKTFKAIEKTLPLEYRQKML